MSRRGLAALVDTILLNHSIGARSRLDVLARRMYGKKFSELFVEEPEKAVRLLMNYAGPSSGKALLSIIVRALVKDPVKTESIVEDLLRGRDSSLKAVLRDLKASGY